MSKKIEYIGSIEEDLYIEKYNYVVICGMGELGKKIYKFLKSNKTKYSIVFCDSNPKLWNTQYDGITIYTYDNVITNNTEAVFLIANLDVKKTFIYLDSRNVENIHIMR